MFKAVLTTPHREPIKRARGGVLVVLVAVSVFPGVWRFVWGHGGSFGGWGGLFEIREKLCKSLMGGQALEALWEVCGMCLEGNDLNDLKARSCVSTTKKTTKWHQTIVISVHASHAYIYMPIRIEDCKRKTS